MQKHCCTGTAHWLWSPVRLWQFISVPKKQSFSKNSSILKNSYQCCLTRCEKSFLERGLFGSKHQLYFTCHTMIFHNSNYTNLHTNLLYEHIWLNMFIFYSFFQLIGCMIIGYMAWVLATSVTVSRFLEGTLVSFISFFTPFLIKSFFNFRNFITSQEKRVEAQKNYCRAIFKIKKISGFCTQHWPFMNGLGT